MYEKFTGVLQSLKKEKYQVELLFAHQETLCVIEKFVQSIVQYLCVDVCIISNVCFVFSDIADEVIFCVVQDQNQVFNVFV